ncbi:MAG: FAD:protein FMN transferase, partial [Actinomycetota bacterium]|nr:FAD:protein FMN transferase [Actinomycetota bacterium]
MSAPAAPAGFAAADSRGLGVAVRILVTDPGALATAVAILEDDVAALDRACSRFRADSELSAVNDSAGQAVPISPLLTEAIRVALQTAWVTSGDVDPTLGAALIRLGYDRDFAGLPADGPPVTASVHRLGHWTQVELDQDRHTVRLPPGVRLDLGATAKAWCADRAAARVHAALGCGVLVSLGGDIAT